jgi:hypothetical protein
MKGVLAVVLLVVLAGCAARPAASPGPGKVSAPAPADMVDYPEAACTNLLLFQFVDYPVTDAYLPPGFHPRDPQDFLGAPTAIGQAGVIFLALSCHGPSNDNNDLSSAQLAIFVEHPSVHGTESASYDFYEVARYGPHSRFDDVLAAGGWPRIPAGVNLTVSGGVSDGNFSTFGNATVTDGQGQVASMIGLMSPAIPLTGTVARFWHDGPQGLAYLDYRTPLHPLVGSGTCTARAGTPLAAFAMAGWPGPPMPVIPMVGSPSCPPGEPVVATFPHLVINATAVRLPGVHAA